MLVYRKRNSCLKWKQLLDKIKLHKDINVNDYFEMCTCPTKPEGFVSVYIQDLAAIMLNSYFRKKKSLLSLEILRKKQTVYLHNLMSIILLFISFQHRLLLLFALLNPVHFKGTHNRNIKHIKN